MQVDAYDNDLRDALRRGDVEEALRFCALMDELPPRKTATTTGAALWYVARGLPVFPISPLSKKPYPKTHGLDDATTDPAAVQRMFADKPYANIGIATGHHIDVIDFDGPEAHAEWGKRWPTWESAGIEVLATVSTPRPGGMHVYVPATGGGNRAGMLPGVDYRGLGGYVVAPPSKTHQGTYEFLKPLPEVLP